MINTANYQVDKKKGYFDCIFWFVWNQTWIYTVYMMELHGNAELILWIKFGQKLQSVACLVKKNMNIKKEKVVTITNMNCIDDTIMMNWYCHERDWLKFIGGLGGGRLWRINHHKIRSKKQAREKKGEQKKNIDLLTTLFP